MENTCFNFDRCFEFWNGREICANSHFRFSTFYCKLYEHSPDISCSNFIQRTFWQTSFLCKDFCLVRAQIRVRPYVSNRKHERFYLILCAWSWPVSDKYKFVRLKEDTLKSAKMKRREQSWPTWSGTAFKVSKRNLAKFSTKFLISWNLERFQKPLRCN